jgi:hypothetical protein
MRVIPHSSNIKKTINPHDRLCGLVFKVSDNRSRGPSSIPSASRFSEKQWVWNGVHLAS